MTTGYHPRLGGGVLSIDEIVPIALWAIPAFAGDIDLGKLLMGHQWSILVYGRGRFTLPIIRSA